MTIKGLIAGLALMLLAVGAPANAQDRAFRHKVYDSSVQLYILEPDQNDSSKLFDNPACTATAFEKTPKGYHLLTAAHCVVNEHKGLFTWDEVAPDGTLSITTGDPGNVDHTPATVLMVGNWHDGWDVAVLNVETTTVIPVIPLGDDTKLEMGDKIVSVSAPNGGEIKYWFEGYVSAAHHQIDELLGHQVRSWQNSTFIQLPGFPGSSGASVVSVDQQAIIGIYTSDVSEGFPPYQRIAGAMTPVSVVKEFIANPKLHLNLDPKK